MTSTSRPSRVSAVMRASSPTASATATATATATTAPIMRSNLERSEPALQETPLGRLGRELQRALVGGRRLVAALEPAQQVGPRRMEEVVALERPGQRV